MLHTWGRQLQYHPHIHYLVHGGAVSHTDRQWHTSSLGFYLPVRALSAIYRAKFRDAMAAHGLLADLRTQVWGIDWNVHCQAVGDGQSTLAYLARYVFKVAISNRRIVGIDDQAVSFRYRKVHEPTACARCACRLPNSCVGSCSTCCPPDSRRFAASGFCRPAALPLEEVRARIQMAHGFAQQATPIRLEPPEPLTPTRCPHCGGSLRFVRAMAPPKLQGIGAAIIATSNSGP